AVMNIQIVLNELIKKGSLTEKTPTPTPIMPSHQEVPPKAYRQHTPTSKMPEKSTPPTRHPTIPPTTTPRSTTLTATPMLLMSPNWWTEWTHLKEMSTKSSTFSPNSKQQLPTTTIMIKTQILIWKHKPTTLSPN